MIKILISLMVAMVATNDGRIIHYPTAAYIIEATTMEAAAADTNATVTPTFTPIDAVTTTATVTTAAFTPPWEVVVGVQMAVMVAAMVAAVAWIKKRLGK